MDEKDVNKFLELLKKFKTTYFENNELFKAKANDLEKILQESLNSQKKEDFSSPIIKKNHNYPLPIIREKDTSKIIYLFTDGACRGNPGPGAWGYMIQNPMGDVIAEDALAETGETTNNRMELMAVIMALKKAYELLEKKPYHSLEIIHLYSDSRYVVDGVTKWLAGWKKRNWRKANKSPIENLKIWQELDELVARYHNLHFFWVRGHSGHPQNERCDELANKALDQMY